MYSPISTSISALRGNNKGTGGCKRNVSFITACMYGNLAMSVSCIGIPLPTTCSSSFCTFNMISGLCINSAIAHSRVYVVVSVPATNMFCNKCSISSLSISIFPSSKEILSKASRTSSFPIEPVPSLIFNLSPTKLLNILKTFLTETTERLLIPCKSKTFNIGKKSDKFGAPTSFNILTTISLYSPASSAECTKSAEKKVFDNKLIVVMKATLPISTASSISLHFLMSSKRSCNFLRLSAWLESRVLFANNWLLQIFLRSRQRGETRINDKLY
ncbi:hypothetical protein MtrunA17_Chr8g0355971 [Medicago truncatula]|uniref:Uncharacterized protein n=1 Tax=Medicago truncatula TaxID=3880 RepID=A0A396GPD7_MEDTR|nr:hypothetical protein MtrunA17_Chr8g0355971 [Medicago truncatula]